MPFVACCCFPPCRTRLSGMWAGCCSSSYRDTRYRGTSLACQPHSALWWSRRSGSRVRASLLSSTVCLRCRLCYYCNENMGHCSGFVSRSAMLQPHMFQCGLQLRCAVSGFSMRWRWALFSLEVHRHGFDWRTGYKPFVLSELDSMKSCLLLLHATSSLVH